MATITVTETPVTVTIDGTPATVAPVTQSVTIDTDAAADWLTQSERLKGWAEGVDYEMTAITYHGTYVYTVSTATVKWPDGSAGTFTATSINATWEAIDAYTISHTDSGLTVTQSAVTRDSNGMITTKPALTVA